MAGLCHRCHGALATAEGESSFCQHCGAPQLRVLEENVALEASGEQAEGAGSKRSGQVAWDSVVRYALVVAGISAVLLVGIAWVPAAFPLAWLWTLCGGVIVLGLYQRHHPASEVSAKVGARIGLVYGALAVAAVGLVTAVTGLVARFGLHTMGTLDGLLSNALRQAAEQQASQPGGVTLSADQMRIFYSSEVRAGLALFLLTVGAVFLMAFSAVGGAIGGMMRMRRAGRTGTSGN